MVIGIRRQKLPTRRGQSFPSQTKADPRRNYASAGESFIRIYARFAPPRAISTAARREIYRPAARACDIKAAHPAPGVKK